MTRSGPSGQRHDQQPIESSRQSDRHGSFLSLFRVGPRSDWTGTTANSQIELPLLIKPNKTGLIQQRIVLFLEYSESFRVPINLAVFAKGDE